MMIQYVAFLKGINVGTRNRVKMDALRIVFSNLGLADVRTYLQSGNVIFKTTEPIAGKPPDMPIKELAMALVRRLEAAIEAAVGFSVPLVLRRSEELAEIIRACPFDPAMIEQAEAAAGFPCLHVAFFSDDPTPAMLERLAANKNSDEMLFRNGQVIYFFLPQGVHQSKLASGLSKMGNQVVVTSRNWTTVCAVAALIQ
jgi:uncharacterized protein (DUF1697 family)